MIIFGGYDSNGFINNDIWMFNFDDLTWNLISPIANINSNTSTLSSENLTTTEKIELPLPRYHHSSVLWNNNKMIIFGGLSTNSQVLGDIWIFNLGKFYSLYLFSNYFN